MATPMCGELHQRLLVCFHHCCEICSFKHQSVLSITFSKPTEIGCRFVKILQITRPISLITPYLNPPASLPPSSTHDPGAPTHPVLPSIVMTLRMRPPNRL